MTNRLIKWSVINVVLAVAYFIAAVLASRLFLIHQNIAPIWPSSGIALAALILGGNKCLPGVLLGAASSAVISSDPIPAYFSIGIGNTLAAYVGAKILCGRSSFHPHLRNSTDVIYLGLFGALLACGISSTIGVGSLYLMDWVPRSRVIQAWTVWWTGDALGVLVFAPAILLWRKHDSKWSVPRNLNKAEVALVNIGIVFLSIIIFGRAPTLSFALFPLLIWVALRFGQKATAISVVLITLSAIWKTSTLSDAFMHSINGWSEWVEVLWLQACVGMIALTANILATLFRSEAEKRALQKAEYRLALSQQRLQIALEAGHMAAWQYDFETKELFQSEMLHRLLGLEHPPDQWTLDLLISLIHPEDRDRVRQSIEVALRDGLEGYAHEYRVPLNNGQIRWISSRSRISRNSEGQPRLMVGASMDITQLKEAEADLARALRTRDEFLSIASHELRTPITSLRLQIQCMMQTLRKNRELDLSALEQMLDVANRQASILGKLADDLLDVSKIVHGKLRLEPQKTNLNDLVQDVLSRLSEYIGNSHSEIQFVSDEVVTGEWDRSRLDQVVTNLLSNAVKYGKGQPIEVGVKTDGSRAKLTVRDKGIGIAKENQARIFEKFERVTEGQTFSGLGLGLYICKQIIEAHGGEIRVESEVGFGSKFEVQIPLQS